MTDNWCLIKIISLDQMFMVLDRSHIIELKFQLNTSIFMLVNFEKLHKKAIGEIKVQRSFQILESQPLLFFKQVCLMKEFLQKDVFTDIYI